MNDPWICKATEALRVATEALESAYRHHCVVECVSEDDGCTCSDFDVVRAALELLRAHVEPTPLEAVVKKETEG